MHARTGIPSNAGVAGDGPRLQSGLFFFVALVRTRLRPRACAYPDENGDNDSVRTWIVTA